MGRRRTSEQGTPKEGVDLLTPPEPIMMVTHESVRSENGEEEPKKTKKKDHKKPSTK